MLPNHVELSQQCNSKYQNESTILLNLKRTMDLGVYIKGSAKGNDNLAFYLLVVSTAVLSKTKISDFFRKSGLFFKGTPAMWLSKREGMSHLYCHVFIFHNLKTFYTLKGMEGGVSLTSPQHHRRSSTWSRQLHSPLRTASPAMLQRKTCSAAGTSRTP